MGRGRRSWDDGDLLTGTTPVAALSGVCGRADGEARALD
jgi:hypothetical protein